MFKQLIALTSMGIQTLPQRAGSSSVIVIGIAGVVAVLVSVLAMATGFRHTVADGGRPDRVIVLRGGSDAELNSNVTRSDIDTIANAPGLAKDADGKALLSAELITVVNVPKIDTGDDSNVTLRGVGLQLQKVRPELKIVEPASSRARVALIAAENLDETVLSQLRTIRAQGCARTVLVVSALTDDDVLAVVDAGVSAIVWRWEATASWLSEVVVKAAAGQPALPADVLSRLLKQIERLNRQVLSPRGLTLNGLSAREIEVLRLAADGLDTEEIAQRLAYSPRTVTNVFHDITCRFQLRNRTHAVAYAIREGLI